MDCTESTFLQSVRCDAFLPARTHSAPDNFCPHALRTHACFLPCHTPHPHSHFKIFYIANKILESGRYGIKLSWSADKYAEYIYTLFMWRPKRYDYCFLKFLWALNPGEGQNSASPQKTFCFEYLFHDFMEKFQVWSHACDATKEPWTHAHSHAQIHEASHLLRTWISARIRVTHARTLAH